jgi:hypothetical protein
MRLMLAIMRVSVAHERVRRAAHGADGAKCPNYPRRSDVHALRCDHRALLGPLGSGRESLGVAVHVRAGTELASWRDADDAVRRRRTVHHLRAPVSRTRLGKHGANLGGRLQRPVRAPVRDDGDGRGRRDVGRNRLFYNGSCRAQRIHGSNATKFANRIWPVFEITSNGRQPVRNVWVGWEASVMDGLVAETRTDVAGHYRVCGLSRERITLLAAPAYGNVFSASVDPGSDAIVDIEIARK